MVELASVLVIVGLLASVGVMRFGSGTLENLSAKSFARTLALDLLYARRATISTGENHFLELTKRRGKISSYVLKRRTSGRGVAVDEPRVVPAGVSVATGDTRMEFDFDGSALGSYSATIAGPDRRWSVSTVIATGAVRTVETTP